MAPLSTEQVMALLPAHDASDARRRLEEQALQRVLPTITRGIATMPTQQLQKVVAAFAHFLFPLW